MTVKFYNGRRLVKTLLCSSAASAINGMQMSEIEWTRYKIV